MITLYKGYEIRHVADGYDIHQSDGQLIGHCMGIIGATRRVDQLVSDAQTKLVGKPISLINTREHQRYWLPDRSYWLEIKIVGRYAIHRVVHNETQRVCHEFSIQLGHKNYQRLSMYAQQMAETKYRRPTVRDREGNKKKEKVAYNVCNVKDLTKPLMEDVYFLHLAQMFKGQQTLKHPGELFEIVEITKES
jgi:macrodomain Ter protein organizer (MatP/YcbG family)